MKKVSLLLVSLLLGITFVKAKVNLVAYNKYRTKGIIVLEMKADDFRKFLDSYNVREGQSIKIPVIRK